MKIDLDTIEKVRVVGTLKAHGEVYQAGAERYRPIATGLLREIEEDTGMVEILEIRGEGKAKEPESSAPPEADVETQEENTEEDPQAQVSKTESEEKDSLESYARNLDSDIKFDRRKSIRSLRKKVASLILKKGKELGTNLDSKVELEVLMKEFSELQAAINDLDSTEI